MPRQAKLRRKNGYWMTKAGGSETYFGKVRDVPHADARRLFLDHLKNVSTPRKSAISTEVLCDLHLDWLQKNRSQDLYKQRQYLLSKWCDFEVGQGANRRPIADIIARQIHADDLLAWKQDLLEKKLGETTIQHALAAVKSTARSCNSLDCGLP